MTSQNTHHLNSFYGHEDDTNNNIFPGNQPTMASNNDNVHYHQQPTPNNQHAFSTINSLNFTTY